MILEREDKCVRVISHGNLETILFLGLGVCFHESIALRSDGQTAHVIMLTDPLSLLQEWNWESRLARDMFDVHLERFLWIFV